MAENDNQNNLEESVRSMISDRIKKIREQGAKKTEDAKKTVSPALKAKKPEIDKSPAVKAEGVKTDLKKAGKVPVNVTNEIKSEKKEAKTPVKENVLSGHGSNTVKSEIKKPSEGNLSPAMTDDELKKAADEEYKRRQEAEREEQRRIKEAEREERLKIKEEQRKEKEAQKEEQRKIRDAQREEQRKEREEQRKIREEQKKELQMQKEAERAEKERLKQSEEKSGPGKTGNNTSDKAVNDMEKAVAGTAAAAAAVDSLSETVNGEEAAKAEKSGKGEGVWKSIVDRMNSESAGDDKLGLDIEDESADRYYISPDERKRKKRFGLVKLFLTLGAIAAIAIIIAFFTVRNNSFEHIFDQGLQAFNEEDYDSSIEIFEKLALTEEGGHNVDVLNYLAQSYIKKDRYQDAVDVYNRALQSDPTFGPAVTGLCEMYTKIKDGKSLNATMDKYRGTNMEEYIADYMVSNPAVNPEAGKYDEDLEIAITGDQDVPIFYTLDGSEPNEQSKLYSKPIKASEGTTHIKAISINTLGIRSGIMDKSFTVEYRVPDEPKIALNSGIYVTGQTVTISGDEGCDIYYTTDGSTPTQYSDKYTGPLRLVKGNVILTAICVSNHGKISPAVSKNYIIVQNSKELEEVEKMNSTTNESKENNGETREGETPQNPNETDSWYTDEGENEKENEGLFDWILNGNRD